MSRAIIVGSGPSAKGFVPPKSVEIYGVNATITWLPKIDVWFTLDDAAVRFAKTPRKGTRYFAALPTRYRLPPHVKRLVRLSGPRTSDVGLGRWGAIKGICTFPEAINTGNSVWGALQLAYQRGVREALLVGVDATRDQKVEGGIPNDLSHLPDLFDSALDSMEIKCAGRMSWSGETTTTQRGIEWITR